MTIKSEEFDNEVINDIQICSFMCGLGKGNLHEKQEEYLLKGLVNDAILLILLEDAFNDYAKNKDLSSALKQVGISKTKDGWHSKDLGGKLFTIETGTGNWLPDVIDDYHPSHISEFYEKNQKIKSYEQLCELEESVAKKIKTKFLQKICLLCMRSLGEQDSISPGEIISIENMCKIWNIQHGEVIEWYQSMYEIIKIGYGGLLPPLNVAPFMPNFFDVGDLKTVFYNLNKSEKNKINKLCKHTVDNEMGFAEGIRYIEDNSSKEINKTLLISVHEKDPNGIRFIFSKDGV